MRGAPADGSSFGVGDSRDVVDPQIALAVPELADGATVSYRFDVHYWESDSATELVRSVFNDATLEYMVKSWTVAREDETKAKAALESWMRDHGTKIAAGLIAAAAPAAAGVLAAENLLPLLEKLFDYVRASGDDYHQMHRFVLQIRKVGTAHHFQVTAPSSGASGWKLPGRISVTESVSDAEAANVYRVEWRFRLID